MTVCCCSEKGCSLEHRFGFVTDGSVRFRTSVLSFVTSGARSIGCKGETAAAQPCDRFVIRIATVWTTLTPNHAILSVPDQLLINA